jgi:hypothetical protein
MRHAGGGVASYSRARVYQIVTARCGGNPRAGVRTAGHLLCREGVITTCPSDATTRHDDEPLGGGCSRAQE